MAAAPALLAVLGAAMLAGVAGNVIQHGLLFTTAKLRPDLSKLSLGRRASSACSASTAW